MVTFSVFGPLTGSLRKALRPATLRQRRLLSSIRRAAAAACAGLAVFSALQYVSASVTSRPVVVTARAVTRGTMLSEADVTVTPMPDSPGWDGALDDAALAVGAIIQMDAEAGQPLFSSALGHRPSAPQGHTVIGVRLASSSGQFAAGDLVTLLAGSGCADDAAMNQSGMCVLADRAMVMDGGSARDPPGSGDGSQSGSVDGDAIVDYGGQEDGVVTLAMKPSDALAVMTAQREGPVMAVASDASGDAPATGDAE